RPGAGPPRGHLRGGGRFREGRPRRARGGPRHRRRLRGAVRGARAHRLPQPRRGGGARRRGHHHRVAGAVGRRAAGRLAGHRRPVRGDRRAARAPGRLGVLPPGPDVTRILVPARTGLGPRGGARSDAALAAAWRDRGRDVELLPVPGPWPDPGPAELERLAELVSDAPAGPVLLDGLVGCAAPEVVEGTGRPLT